MTYKQTLQVTAVWHNSGFSASYDNFVVGSSVVPRLNFCAKNPPLRQAANRYFTKLIIHTNTSGMKTRFIK